MATMKRINLLRCIVLIIVGFTVIKFMSTSKSSPPPPPLQIVEEKKIEDDFFWGKKAESRDNLIQKEELPPEPPKEEVVEEKKPPEKPKVPAKDFSTIQLKLVHLDLKGAAPKVSYFEQIFPLLSKLGANGILIEYEDMFPYSGELELLKSPFAYSEEDIKKILYLADINKLEVVPLVQTFGHMEYVLKHDKYKSLREVERYPNSLNPHRTETLPLVKMILTQVLDMHPACSFIHIGSDEVYHLGEGQDSKNWLNSNKGDLGKMFLTHAKEVVSFLHTNYPDKRQMMWDDMLRKLSVENIKASEISQHVSPVLWIYDSDFDLGETEKLISKYQECGFPSIWFASAFKGASGPDRLWTPINMHMKNHQHWKKVIDSMHKFPKIHYSGIALTGWQRYDHYSVLCELLPVSIPSLAVCLYALQHGEFTEEARKETAHVLGFNSIDVEKNICDGNGAFPGAEIFGLVRTIRREMKTKVQEIMEGDSDIRGWFSRYHRKHQFGNPHKLEKFQDRVLTIHNDWDNLTASLRTQLETIYFPDTVEEWMEENVNPILDPLRQMVKDLQEILPLNARPKAVL